MAEIKKLFETKFRYLIGFLIGGILAVAWMLSYFVEIPKSNEVMFAEIRTSFTMAFGAFINHIMKTPEKEKRNENN
jgi:hypothetical protein